MKPGRRYHTPELSFRDRSELWSVLGWGKNLIGLVEHDGARILNCQLSEEDRGYSLVRWPLETLPHPAVFFQYRATLPVVSEVEGQDLWRELLPHPLNLIRPLREQVEISYSSDQIGAEVGQLMEAFAQLEDALSLQEFTLISFLSPVRNFAVLVHAVRGRCVRLGTSSEIQAVADGLVSLGEWNAPVRHIRLVLNAVPVGIGELAALLVQGLNQDATFTLSPSHTGAETCNPSDFLIPT